VNRRSFLRSGLSVSVALSGIATVAGATRPSDADRASIRPLGRTTVPKAKEAVVSADGRTGFLAVTDGFAVVDIADPADPTVVYENREPWAGEGKGRLEQIFDVKLDRESDLLAVVGPANPRDAFRGLIVYDVSDRTNPERVAVHETDFFNHNCFAADGHVYLCGNTGDRNALVIVEAETGTEVGRWSIADVDERWAEVGTNWVLHDVTVTGDTAYLAHWDAGTWAVDVSDPAAPALVTKVRGRDPETLVDMTRSEARRDYSESPGNDHFVATDDSGDLLGISVEAWDIDTSDDHDGGPGGITLYDIADPTSPRELATIEPPPTPDPTHGGVWTTSHNFSFYGDRLYTSWYEGGVRVYDVSDPAEPALLARWRDSDAASFWTAELAVDGEFFLASSHRDGSLSGDDSSSENAAVYTFPDPPADAAPLVLDTPAGTPTPTVTDGSSPTDTATATATVAGNGTATGTPTAASGPGLGPVATLAGLGLGAWRLLRSGGDGNG
jgi:hypothetical protein